MNSTKTAFSVVATLAIAATLLVQACSPPDRLPVIRKDDAGDLSWARQVVPVLLGRKVKGRAEAKLLADLVAATDRSTVARGLMNRQEFRDYWSEVLVTQLRVDREGTKAQTDCYAAPLRGGAPTGDLASHLLTASPATAAPGGNFNMSDVIRSALVLDNLAPVYRAHMFALEHHPDFLSTEQQTRDDLGRAFGEVFINRQMLCLTCHNTEFSTTGPDSGWTRHFPITGTFEKALYGASSGIDTADAHAMFRTDQHSFSPSGAFVRPWGMNGCGAFNPTMPANTLGSPYFTGALASGATVTTLASRFKTGYDGLASNGLDRVVPTAQQPACDFCKNSCSGSAPLDPESVVNGTFVRDFLIDTDGPKPHNCGSCHGSAAGLWFAGGPDPWYAHLINVSSGYGGLRVKPGDAANSVLIHKLKGDAGFGTRMPQNGPAYASASDISKIEAWIDALPDAASCSNCPSLDCKETQVTGTEAFAYLVAEKIVNVVWQEVMGSPLTIANYFPRNFSQRAILWNLTEHTFIPNEWSLKELLVRIVTSDFFNRTRPELFASGTPYELPAAYDPWIAPDPRVPPVDTSAEANHNAMSDGIYRYSTQNLLVSSHKAMDWPGIARFPIDSPTAYPNKDFAVAMGEYFSAQNPGSRVTTFPNLLKWEKEHGLCTNRNPGATTDWIDRLATAASGFTPPSGEGPLTVKEVMAVLRDWLLSQGDIGTVAPAGVTDSEETALAAVVGSLSANVSTLSLGDLKTKLRSVCGIMLESPQFFLAGIAPDGAGTNPRLRVCNGSPCSYKEMCEDLKTTVTMPSRTTLLCGDDSVSTLSFPRIPDWIEIELCPPGGCWPEKLRPPEGCFTDPLDVKMCFAVPQPPACDPRCSRIDCCGGPAPQLGYDATFVIWADGAQVKQAEGVRILRAGTRKIETLQAGQRVNYGDLIQVPPAAKLEIQGEKLKFATSVNRKVDKARVLLVTGPQALKRQTEAPQGKPPTKGQLDWEKKFGVLRFTDGVPPAPIKASDRGRGKTEEEFDALMKKRLGDQYNPQVPSPKRAPSKK